MPTFPLASDIRFAGALDEVTDSFDRRLGWSLVGGNRGIVLGALHRSKTLWFWKECWKPSEPFGSTRRRCAAPKGFWQVTPVSIQASKILFRRAKQACQRGSIDRQHTDELHLRRSFVDPC